jgi:hypothetical protein
MNPDWQNPGAPPPGAIVPNPYAPPTAPIGAAPAVRTGGCQMCGRHAPTKQVRFMRNIGLLVIRFPRTVDGMLCRRCIDDTFWKFTMITLFLGWWGVISFFYSLVSIPLNIVNYVGARSLPADFDR